MPFIVRIFAPQEEIKIMKKTTIIAFVLGLFLASCGSNAVETGEAQEVTENNSTEAVEYATVGEGSHVQWRAAHLGGIVKRFGKINPTSASVKTLDNKVTNATITIGMASLTVENFDEGDESKGKLEGHLKSADFFDVENNATATFELTGIEAGTGDYNSMVTGNLTIMDSTKSITFGANVTVTEESVTVKSEDFTVNREDWGLTYNKEGTENVPAEYLISSDLGFTIDATINK